MEKLIIGLCLSAFFCTSIVAKENAATGQDGISFSNSVSTEKIYRWEEKGEIRYGDVRPINDLSSRDLIIMNLPLSDDERISREEVSPGEANRVMSHIEKHQRDV